MMNLGEDDSELELEAELDRPPLDALPIARLVRPRLRLYSESVWADEGRGFGSDFRERAMPVLALAFEYEGFTVRAADESDRIFCGRGGAMAMQARDRQAERRARYMLESFGAIELELLDDHATAPGSDADYLVNLGDDAHSRCAFTAYALPQLRALGWAVEVAPNYPYQVLEREPPWYAAIDELGDKPDWFSLELGVEVDGDRVNLLPVLLDLLQDDRLRLDRKWRAQGSPRFVRVPGTGRYVAVPGERLELLLQVVAELYQGTDVDAPTISFPGMRASALERLDQALGDRDGLRWQGGEALRERGRALSSPPSAASGECRSRLLHAELRPYQESGVRWLAGLREHGACGVLADDMGLGKTLQTIALLCLECESGRAAAPSLIVAPTSLMGNWKREFARFAPALRVTCLHGARRASLHAEAESADVVVTSYPILVRDEAFFTERAFHFLVLDEAQTIKNRSSRASSLVREVDAEHRLCLTGTPIENNLSELWSLFDFLMPGLLGDELQFKHFFRVPIEQWGDDGRLQALRDQVAPYILRRMKSEVASELPPKTDLVLPVELYGKQRELYESIRVAAHAKVRSAISKRGLGASTVTILDALMRLRQLCCDPRLLRGEAARFVRESAKYEALMELLERQLGAGRRVLVFSQFASMLALIARGLHERRVRYSVLTGATQNRDKAVREFESGQSQVFLISLKAGGTGLNLISADTVVHYDPWWNPAAQDQATDRAYRIGQTKPVFVYNLIAAGSVEERMLALQQRKRKLAETIVGSGAKRDGAFTERDVEHLLAPLE